MNTGRAFKSLWFICLVRPIVRLVIGVSVFGRERLNHSEPVIIVANHNSHLDALVLMDLLPRKCLHRTRPVAAADYFQKHPVRRFVFEQCMHAVPIRRDKVTKSSNPLTAVLEAMDQGNSIVIFPEGSRGQPEQMAELKTGVAHLISRRPETKVIPVFMRNLGFSLPRGDFILVPMFCDVFVGKPRCMPGSKPEIMQQLADSFDELRAIAERMRAQDAPEDDR